MAIHAMEGRGFHSKPPSCSACRSAGRMAIHAMEGRGFHSKPPSCSACRSAGRMAIHTMEGRGFHNKPPSCSACRLAGRMAIHAMEGRGFHSKTTLILWRVRVVLFQLTNGHACYTTYFLSTGIFCIISDAAKESPNTSIQNKIIPLYPTFSGVIWNNL